MTTYKLDLPTENTPDYTYTTFLDKVKYILYFTYKTRTEDWYFSLSDKDDNPLIINKRIHPYVDLLSPLTREKLPTGSLAVVPLKPNFPDSPEITLENLSTLFELWYVTEE